jgi:arginine/ornithine transport system substrate-binding protein
MRGLQSLLAGPLMAASLALCIGTAAAEPLRYCVEADLPPFSYKTAAGGVEGFDVDFATAVCSKIGMECHP